jgi:hypothetical protein
MWNCNEFKIIQKQQIVLIIPTLCTYLATEKFILPLFS